MSSDPKIRLEANHIEKVLGDVYLHDLERIRGIPWSLERVAEADLLVLVELSNVYQMPFEPSTVPKQQQTMMRFLQQKGKVENKIHEKLLQVNRERRPHGK